MPFNYKALFKHDMTESRTGP